MYLAVRLSSLIHVAAVAECHALATTMGVSRQLVYDLISGAAGSSSQFNQVFPKMVQGDFSREQLSKYDPKSIGNAMIDLVSITKILIEKLFIDKDDRKPSRFSLGKRDSRVV